MPTYLIGLSGNSASGKTTTAHLLKCVFPLEKINLLHADDFCKDFDSTPSRYGFPDCDSPDAINYTRMIEVLDFIKDNEGSLPAGYDSQKQNETLERALTTVSANVVTHFRDQVKGSRIAATTGVIIVIVDGLLLYQNPDIRKRLDLKLFFRLSHDTAKHRRCTKEPPCKEGAFLASEEYFEKMAWRNYREQHAFLFKNGDVEGEIDEDSCKQVGVQIMPVMDATAEENIGWTIERVLEFLERK